MSTLICLALTRDFFQHNIYQNRTPATSMTKLLSTTGNCWMLLMIVSKCSIPDVPEAQLLCVHQIFFIFNTDLLFSLFLREPCIDISVSYLLFFLTQIFSIFFRKLDGTSPVAPKTIGIISNIKLGYNLFSSDDNCI